MKIYVASSWRNEFQPEVVRQLRLNGHEVYDFRNPGKVAGVHPHLSLCEAGKGNTGFSWRSIDHDWENWTPLKYREMLDHPTAEAGFRSDMDALEWCDAVVAVQPFGRSASLELGWAAGAGKLTVLLLADGEPELMVKMCDHLCLSMGGVLSFLKDHQQKKAV